MKISACLLAILIPIMYYQYNEISLLEKDLQVLLLQKNVLEETINRQNKSIEETKLNTVLVQTKIATISKEVDIDTEQQVVLVKDMIKENNSNENQMNILKEMLLEFSNE